MKTITFLSRVNGIQQTGNALGNEYNVSLFGHAEAPGTFTGRWASNISLTGAGTDPVRAFGGAVAREGGVRLTIEIAEPGEPAFEATEKRKRTPEVVLRAMLAAYESALIEGLSAYYRAPEGTTEEALEELDAERLAVLAHKIRHALAATIAGRNAFEIVEFTDPLASDYEARIKGKRPLDATPPVED